MDDGSIPIPKAYRVPEGFRPIRDGEVLPRGRGAFKLQWHGSREWTSSDGSMGGETYRDNYHGLVWNGVVPKAPAKPKAPKPVWSTKFLSIHPKSTKADLVKLLQETVDQLNETGTKLVAAQNTITRLKKKVSK